MSFERCSQVHLAAVKSEDPWLDPVALPVSDADDFAGSHGAQVIQDKPRLKRRRCSPKHRADLGFCERFVWRWPQRQRPAASQRDGRDQLMLGCPGEKRSHRNDIMVDRFRCVLLKHVLFQSLQVADANRVGAGLAMPANKAAEMLRVVHLKLRAALAFLRFYEAAGDVLDQRTFDAGSGCPGAGHVLAPGGPLRERRGEQPAGGLAVSAEVPLAAAPFRHPTAVRKLAKAWRADVHLDRSHPHRSPTGLLRSPGAGGAGLRITISSALSRAYNSPSRTRTYNLAVNSRSAICHKRRFCVVIVDLRYRLGAPMGPHSGRPSASSAAARSFDNLGGAGRMSFHGHVLLLCHPGAASFVSPPGRPDYGQSSETTETNGARAQGGVKYRKIGRAAVQQKARRPCVRRRFVPTSVTARCIPGGIPPARGPLETTRLRVRNASRSGNADEWGIRASIASGPSHDDVSQAGSNVVQERA